MNIQPVVGALHTSAAETLVVTLYELQENGGERSATLDALDGALGGAIRDLIGSGDLTGKASQISILYPRGAIPARRVLLVGLGKRDAANPETVRRATAAAIQRARDLKAVHVAFATDALTTEEAARAVTEGALLGLYVYHGQKSSERPASTLEALDIVVNEPDLAAAQNGVALGRAMAEGQLLARELANLPPNICTPSYLAETAHKVAEQTGLRAEVLEKRQMESLKMGALLAVARGSNTPPKFIILEHNPDRADLPTLVLVGKGITFDTGGYSIKTAEGMVSMKNDMSGAAAVLGAMQIVGALKLPLHVVGLVPTCDNMINGEAYLPSEVLTASNGLTIEVISTDAEGRLVLADALVYAGRYNPAAVVDIATLTGSIGVALGSAAAGLFCTDDKLRDRLMSAGTATHERLWPMPIFSDYDKLIDSKTADMKNTGGRYGGASIGAVFLKRFTSYPAWAHVDMAMMASDVPDSPTIPGGGATGYGARLLAEFVRTWQG